MWGAAASARLCVETAIAGIRAIYRIEQPPPRGCVLKRREKERRLCLGLGSRLRAAVC